MPSQYMPYRKGDFLKAADVNLLLASVPFYTNSGSMGIGTDSVMVTPIENSVWVNVTDSIDSGKLKQEDVHPHGVIYGVPRPAKAVIDSLSDAGKEGQSSFGSWYFYSKRPKSSLCQAFYTLTGVMSPAAIAQADSNSEDGGGETSLQADGTSSIGDESATEDGGSTDESSAITQTSPLGDLATSFGKGNKINLQEENLLSYQQLHQMDEYGKAAANAPAMDNMSGQLFVGVTPMVPGERYILDVNNNYDDEPLSPGEEYVYDAETNRLKKVKSGSTASSDMVVHRRRYHPKTSPYAPGMDPRFALGDDNLIWCGGEGYFSGKVGNPLDPPEGYEIGPIYRIEYGDEVFVGKFSLKDFHFWNIETGYIVPGWVDKNTGFSVFHPSSSSSDGLLQTAPSVGGLLGDEPATTGDDAGGSEETKQDEGVTLGSSFGQYNEDQRSCLAEIVYTPIATAETVEEAASTLGTVRLPISSVLIPAMDVPPRMDAPLDLNGRSLYDNVDGDDSGDGEDDAQEEESEQSGTVSFPKFGGTESKSVAYSYLVAKAIGLVEPADSTPAYQEAYYAAEDKVRPFCKKVSIAKGNGSTTGKLKTAVTQSGWGNIQIKSSHLIKAGENNDPDEYICFGTYEPDELRTAEPIYFDLLSQSKRLYTQRIEADYVKNSSYARYVSLLRGSTDADTCGWVRYRYYDELEANQKAEKVEISLPTILGTDVGVSNNRWTVGNAEFDPVQFTPFWSGYGLGYGYAETQSIDSSTLTATVYYYPYRDGRDQQEEEQQETTSGSVPYYDQYHSFPFFFDGLPQPKRARLTTKTYKAHRSDWVPAICKTLDHNEVLIPGMVVEIEEATTTVNDQTFRYLIVTPPESYSTVLEGTPEQVVYKVTYRAPSPSDLEAGTIKEDDCWITGIKKLDDDESPQMNPPSGTIYRFGVKLNSETGAPKITEPFGAFNNCDNKGSLTVFLRTTAWGVNYTCTARLDHIPFGYAVPSKTPSCYYKSGNDDCAAHMVGQRYLVKRIEADNRLYLTGACYVPCSTLSSFT